MMVKKGIIITIVIKIAISLKNIKAV